MKLDDWSTLTSLYSQSNRKRVRDKNSPGWSYVSWQQVLALRSCLILPRDNPQAQQLVCSNSHSCTWTNSRNMHKWKDLVQWCHISTAVCILISVQYYNFPLVPWYEMTLSLSLARLASREPKCWSPLRRWVCWGKLFLGGRSTVSIYGPALVCIKRRFFHKKLSNHTDERRNWL